MQYREIPNYGFFTEQWPRTQHRQKLERREFLTYTVNCMSLKLNVK